MQQTNMPGSASGVLDRVRSSATAQLSSQKTRATDGLGSIAQAVRQTTQPLRDNKQDAIAQYVDKAADQIERFSAQLRDKDVSELVNDAQQFARRQPAMFIGAAFAVGVLTARFLKSSSAETRRDWNKGNYGESMGQAGDYSASRTPATRTGSSYTTGVDSHTSGGGM
jgi:ElaB/YqjD/DUF883 family membrane-anchored ribosome-binding protein